MPGIISGASDRVLKILGALLSHQAGQMFDNCVLRGFLTESEAANSDDDQQDGCHRGHNVERRDPCHGANEQRGIHVECGKRAGEPLVFARSSRYLDYRRGRPACRDLASAPNAE